MLAFLENFINIVAGITICNSTITIITWQQKALNKFTAEVICPKQTKLKFSTTVIGHLEKFIKGITKANTN